MSVEIKELSSENLAAAVEIWNRVVEDGVAFPQTEKLTLDAGREFFKEQSFTGVALDGETKRVAGLYILH
ncbi:MAG: N-acetyltransferase, partial [Ruminococcaceae bacterium]|nr:N-acetyltransferase [Oscillospiraceae bacterium]